MSGLFFKPEGRVLVPHRWGSSSREAIVLGSDQTSSQNACSGFERVAPVAAAGAVAVAAAAAAEHAGGSQDGDDGASTGAVSRKRSRTNSLLRHASLALLYPANVPAVSTAATALGDTTPPARPASPASRTPSGHASRRASTPSAAAPGSVLRYAMRAECVHDAFQAFDALRSTGRLREFTLRPDVSEFSMPDVDIAFSVTAPFTLQELRAELREGVHDSHVLVETLNTEAAYTGERYLDEDEEDDAAPASVE